jgi:hypothetical protein
MELYRPGTNRQQIRSYRVAGNAVLRIRDVAPGSRVRKAPDSRSATKNEVFLTQKIVT